MSQSEIPYERQLLDWLRSRVSGTDATNSGDASGLDVREVPSGDSCLQVKLTENTRLVVTARVEEGACGVQAVPDCFNEALSVKRLDGKGYNALAALRPNPKVVGNAVEVELVLEAQACGFASFDLAGVRIHWETVPKIVDTNWEGLLAMASGLSKLAVGQQADYEQAPESLREVLIVAYLGAVGRLLHIASEGGRRPEGGRMPGGGLRRAYDARHELLRGRLRGQLDRPGYLRQLVQGRPDRVPCRYHLHDLDNLPNRALRWGLHLCLGLLPGVTQESRRRGLEKRIRTVDARFGGVAWTRVTRADLPHLRQPPRVMKAYETSGALPLARLLLEQAQLGSTSGTFNSVALAFDMPKLFENAFARGFPTEFGPTQSQASWALLFKSGGEQWKSGENSLRPDLYLPARHPRPALVVDTKWKDADAKRNLSKKPDQAASEDEDVSAQVSIDGLTLKVKREDLHQILSYALAVRSRPEQSNATVRAALVYPTNGQRLHAEMRWPGGSNPYPWLEVVVVGWPIQRGEANSPRESLEALAQSLCAPVRSHGGAASVAAE